MAEGPERRAAVITADEVPSGLQDLITIAERWGIRNNAERDELLESSTTEQLREFVRTLEPRCPEIDRWLHALPKDVGQWPRAAVTFLWLRRTWHEVACELCGRKKYGGT
jgi:hypothetical protein